MFENYLILYIEILSPSRISVTGYNFHQHHQWHIDICKTPTTITTLMKWKHNTKATLFGWHWCYPLAYFLPILFDYFFTINFCYEHFINFWSPNLLLDQDLKLIFTLLFFCHRLYIHIIKWKCLITHPPSLIHCLHVRLPKNWSLSTILINPFSRW